MFKNVQNKLRKKDFDGLVIIFDNPNLDDLTYYPSALLVVELLTGTKYWQSPLSWDHTRYPALEIHADSISAIIPSAVDEAMMAELVLTYDELIAHVSLGGAAQRFNPDEIIKQFDKSVAFEEARNQL